MHGRGQQHRDPAEPEAEWLAALDACLASNGLTFPAGCGVRLAYYGDTLARLASRPAPSAEAAVTVRGEEGDLAWQQFIGAVARQAQERFAVTDEEVAAACGLPAVERGWANWVWTLAVFRTLDRRVPGASAAGIKLRFRDV